MKTTVSDHETQAGSMTDDLNRPHRLPVFLLRALGSAAEALAVLGGVALVLSASLTVYSVLARYFFHTPFVGDFEIVELSCVVIVSLCLPYCQFVKGHAVVEMLTSFLPQKLSQTMDHATTLVVAAFYALIAWRSCEGMLAMIRTADQTMVLGIPRYLAFPPLIVSFSLCALIALSQPLFRHRGAET